VKEDSTDGIFLSSQKDLLAFLTLLQRYVTVLASRLNRSPGPIFPGRQLELQGEGCDHGVPLRMEAMGWSGAIL